MAKCKQCKNEIQTQLAGLKQFCTHECKKEHRQKYQAKWISQKRRVDSEGGYVGINPRLVDSAKPCLSTVSEGENCSPRLSNQYESYESFGGFKWYQIAKNQCCNFNVRQKEGYCVTLAEPYRTFRVMCSDCSYLGHLLR